MPQIHQPDPPPTHPPVCPDCLRPMRLSTTEPKAENANLRHGLFVCDCGRISDQLVAKNRVAQVLRQPPDG
jgi:hypothetical protein